MSDKITICCIDCVSPYLALRAIRLSQAALPGAKAVFLTNSDETFEGVTTIRIAPLVSAEAYSAFMIKRLSEYIETTHALVVQWDGYIVNPSAWTEEFLAYDYIGAPWEFHGDNYKVGNGGFSLRSKTLLETLRQEEFAETHPEDVSICRIYRPLLEEKYQIKFAPEGLARRFSFESGPMNPNAFGFHALHNMGNHIRPEELSEFISYLSPEIIKSKQYLLLGEFYIANQRYEDAQRLFKLRVQRFPDDRAGKQRLTECQRLLSPNPLEKLYAHVSRTFFKEKH